MFSIFYFLWLEPFFLDVLFINQVLLVTRLLHSVYVAQLLYWKILRFKLISFKLFCGFWRSVQYLLRVSTILKVIEAFNILLLSIIRRYLLLLLPWWLLSLIMAHDRCNRILIFFWWTVIIYILVNIILVLNFFGDFCLWFGLNFYIILVLSLHGYRFKLRMIFKLSVLNWLFFIHLFLATGWSCCYIFIHLRLVFKFFLLEISFHSLLILPSVLCPVMRVGTAM